MRFLDLHALPAMNIPPAQLTITISAHHPVPTRSPSQRRNPSWMLHQDTDAFPTVGVPDEEFPSVAVAVARGYPPVIETPGHACDNSLVSHQPEQKPVTPGIPHIDVTIFAR